MSIAPNRSLQRKSIHVLSRCHVAGRSTYLSHTCRIPLRSQATGSGKTEVLEEIQRHFTRRLSNDSKAKTGHNSPRFHYLFGLNVSKADFGFRARCSPFLGTSCWLVLRRASLGVACGNMGNPVRNTQYEADIISDGVLASSRFGSEQIPQRRKPRVVAISCTHPSSRVWTNRVGARGRLSAESSFRLAQRADIAASQQYVGISATRVCSSFVFFVCVLCVCDMCVCVCVFLFVSVCL